MTDEVVIRVENLGKKYRIRHQAERQRYTALRDVIAQKLFAPFKFLRSRLKMADGALRAEDRKSKIGDGAAKEDGSSKMEDSSLGSLSTNSNLLTVGEALSPISQLPSSRASKVEDFWALKDVSFEVRQGEVVGIIGLPRAIDFHQLSAFPISAFPILK